METVSAKVAAYVAGFRTVAMLDYLERSGIFVRSSAPKVRGKRRGYSFRDLVVLKVIGSILNSGASADAVKKALVLFQADHWKADRNTLGFHDAILKYLFVSAGEIYYAKSADTLYNMSKSGQMAFGFVIDVDRLHTELCNSLDQRVLPLAG
jgi:DNA-binding transcriptional MerR regulator